MTGTIKIKNSKKPYGFIVIDKEKFDPQIHERFFSFDEVIAELRSEYRKIIEYVWDHYLSTDEWILEQVLFHPSGPLATSGLKQSDLQNLSGLVYQFDDSGNSKYQVTFPAVFFTDRGNEYEGIIYAYIRHLQERYQKDPYIESVSSEDLVSGNIISESWAHKLGRLIQLSGFLYGGSFSIGSEGWSAGFPSKLVIESLEHTDLKEYIRSLVMDRYDPSSPVFEGDRWTKKEQHNKVFRGESISEKELSPNSKAIGIKSSYNSESNSEDNKMPDPRKVFVVHGRDNRLRDSFFSFLRALGLQPIEWSEALKLTGKATPYIGEALDSAFKNAQSVIVLLTPDDEVRLSPELWKDTEDENEKEIRLQARPNVLFEAGMAFGTHHDRTLLVEIGQVKEFSDVAGRHVVRLSNSSDKRNEIAERLRTAGCDVSTSGNDWLNVGDFSVQRGKADSISSRAEENGTIVPPAAESDFRDRLLKPYQTIGAPGVGNGEFQFGGGSDANAGIFVDYNYLYVTDWNNNRLQRFALGVDKLWKYFDCVSDSGELYSAVYVDKNGTMFLQGMGLLRKFDANKNPLGDIEIDISNFCRFVIDREGNILAQSRSERNMINKYDAKGECLFVFGGFGNSDGRFNNEGWSVDIVSDGAGNIYMLDIGGNRVQKFDNNGNFLKKWHVSIAGYSYMAIDENDLIYVVENGYTLLRQYSTDGVLIQQYRIPQGVVSGGASYIFVNQNLFFVSNRFNHNINVFSFA